jgi:3-hydroxybutyryl-CoA dehydrogenase
MESLICICGAGTMGRGIALSAAAQGISVILYDLNPDMLKAALTGIENELVQAVAKKRITPEKKANIIRNIRFSDAISDCSAPLIIEAIVEKIDAKSSLFTSLSAINSEDTIFLSNTSSLSITAIAELTSFPARVAGMHFFNPANKMKLVEIVMTKYISEPVADRLKEFALQLEKTAVLCLDTPGFIVNRVARPFYLEAMRLTERNKIDMDCIDNAMEAAGFRMGPFHLMDLIGLDVNYAVSCSVYESLGRPARMKPSSLQEVLVQQAHLGKKTGSGFFQYPKKSAE